MGFGATLDREPVDSQMEMNLSASFIQGVRWEKLPRLAGAAEPSQATRAQSTLR